MATIAMPHVGLGGHLLPAARVGAVLAEHGHRVIAWAPERYRERVEVAGVEFREHEPAVTRQPFPSLVHFAAEVAEGTERSVDELARQMLDEEVDIVVHDVHVPWARVAADFLGLPRVVTDPLFPQAWKADGGSGGVVSGFFAEPLDRLERARDGIARRWGVDLGGWQDTIHSRAPTTLCFTTEEILGEVTLPAGWHAVGPLLVPVERQTVMGRPLVYVAFGTFFNADPWPFRTVIEALADESVDVLVATGGGTDPGALGALPSNVEVREFVRSREVLAGAAAHVSHGGGSSVHESLAAGVPLVCTPLGSDQSAWAERAQALGAGVVVEPRPAAIRAAVRAVLDEPRWTARTRELGERLLGHPGAALLTAAIDAVLRSDYVARQ